MKAVELLLRGAWLLALLVAAAPAVAQDFVDRPAASAASKGQDPVERGASLAQIEALLSRMEVRLDERIDDRIGELLGGASDPQPHADTGAATLTVPPVVAADAAGSFDDDPEVRAAVRELFLARVEREIQILKERRDVLRWTNWISRFMFGVVHVILFLGLRAALAEFKHSARTRKDSAGETEMRVSLEGIALKTSLHGMVILVAAFGFYFLYIRFVYPITEL